MEGGPTLALCEALGPLSRYTGLVIVAVLPHDRFGDLGDDQFFITRSYNVCVLVFMTVVRMFHSLHSKVKFLCTSVRGHGEEYIFFIHSHNVYK